MEEQTDSTGAAQRVVIEVTCPNPECHKRFRMYKPEKPGVVRVTCPVCKEPFQFKYQDKTPTSGDNSTAAERTVTMEPTADDIYKFMCPHCAAQAMGIAAKGRNLLKTACPRCKGPVTLVVDRPQPPTETVDDVDVTDMFDDFEQCGAPKINAVLRVYTKRRLLPDIKTDFPIVEGSYCIGRADPECQPDIPLNGDTTVSRRSVQIEVVKSGNENVYPLTVLKAANPVMVNGKRYRAGESVYLNFNDRITMGKTELVFVKETSK